MLNRKLRMGMIGGGPGAFIGAIHRIAARLDNEIELVAGAFSSDPVKSTSTGNELHLVPERVYPSYQEMIHTEATLPADKRIDIVSIVTPNHLHFEPAKLALENGFYVVLDKPMVVDVREAEELAALVHRTHLLFCLTHTYTGYPMIKEARYLVSNNRLGAIRKVFVEYPQGWLSTALETEGNKQAAWRTDPSRSGMAGAVGDIGTHAFQLAEYVSGLSVTRLCAHVNTIVPGRALDDDAAVLLQFNNGASGVLIVTQVAAGEENNIRLRVVGEKGSLDWCHRDPNSLVLKWPNKPAETWRAGESYLSPVARQNSRTPAGHPEGYLEAFANHYRNFALSVKARITGERPAPEWLDFPGIDDGLRGMRFIEAVIKNGRSDIKWSDL